MVDAPVTSYGTRVYMGAPAASNAYQSGAPTQDEVADQSWIEVVRVERTSQLGEQAPELTFMPVDGPTRRSGGELDQGVFEFTCAAVRDDAGQAVFRQACVGEEDYFMRVLYSDGVEEYFTARPLSARRHADSSVAPLRLVCRAALTSGILEVG